MPTTIDSSAAGPRALPMAAEKFESVVAVGAEPEPGAPTRHAREFEGPPANLHAPRAGVAAHSACWATATGLREGKLAETTLQRWQKIHALLEAGVGLLDCSRRLGLALNTVKRHARAATPQRIQRVPE
ncbi:hypothetical protein [Actinokineospora iranica]|uniref:Homeodomain-like domain-containing protein n=1 Tax=Actinokineospora iranica TaxID=1271860 RepID=A0A1G6VVG7_9PSEU|nr:hypothetical protein [Actinokineospora iranica]SDD57680.1 hypothetical protein SAMN05216174_113124 [Actinokineospora iranica]